ncbi:hypothetical protein I8751_11145 [Nostocaceae cyanobacterium CENA357]|uniref:Uncharacterized protein n=1 Tax=Atlanticothrix silvestris CENA357 TaxID=1725252 RepID=A0A8J7HCS6_9CYAN|nr:hypothetical protein [Atlanticothrix silvestris]MBH8552914.1 hypothetical protein [Atlanticothrix silvestris CENA357]
MAKSSIADLHYISPERLQDTEHILQELSDIESMLVHGGKNNVLNENIDFGTKALEYALVGFAIYNIVSLVKLFINRPQPQ